MHERMRSRFGRIGIAPLHGAAFSVHLSMGYYRVGGTPVPPFHIYAINMCSLCPRSHHWQAMSDKFAARKLLPNLAWYVLATLLPQTAHSQIPVHANRSTWVWWWGVGISIDFAHRAVQEVRACMCVCVQRQARRFVASAPVACTLFSSILIQSGKTPAGTQTPSACVCV